MASKLEDAIEEKGGIDRFWDRLASAETLEEIARDYGCSLRLLYQWRNQNDERRALWDEALRISGDAYAAEAKSILDDLHARTRKENAKRLESAEVALAQARSVQRMKLAAARNPSAYGERPTVQVNQQFNVGQMHLEALKAKGSATAVNGPGTARMLEAAIPTSEASGNIVGFSSALSEESE